MKLALYVHDLKLEIGHSNSLIELVRHLPASYKQNIESVEIVTFSTTSPEVLFPEFAGKIRWVKVPFPNISPVLVKSLFYQTWTFFYNRFFQDKEFFRIGIGISSIDVHAVSVQFIHHQWTHRGLEMEGGHFLRRAYKSLLFRYFEWCENYLFKQKGLKVFSPAQFLTDFLKGRNQELQTATIYSGVNLNRFELVSATKAEILKGLVDSYPDLRDLDDTKPVYLFVGAYERKGLNEVLEVLGRQKEGSQLIVIGNPSLGRTVNWPKGIKVFPITFTREVPKFYSISDVFFFPTKYEPFGLVIFEAMAMGLQVITRRTEVGASELLENLPEIYFCDSEGFKLPEPKVLDYASRSNLREERLKLLGDVSWSKAGTDLARFLQDNKVS